MFVNIYCLLVCMCAYKWQESNSAVQSQNAVSVLFTNNKIQHFYFAISEVVT